MQMVDKISEAFGYDEQKSTELSKEDYDAFIQKLNEPPKVLPRLKELMEKDIFIDEPDGVAFNPLGSSPDIINNPSHYNRNGIETIDVLKAYLTPEEFKGYLKGTQICYLLRSPYKRQEKDDIKKANWYSNRLSEEIK